MEWDIAAGDAVLVVAGGYVRTLEGEELRYGKDGFWRTRTLLPPTRGTSAVTTPESMETKGIRLLMVRAGVLPPKVRVPFH